MLPKCIRFGEYAFPSDRDIPADVYDALAERASSSAEVSRSRPLPICPRFPSWSHGGRARR